MAKQDNPLAFPREVPEGDYKQSGMTLLDYFAAKAMNTVLNETQETVPASIWDWVKQLAYGYGLTFLKVKYKHIDGVYEQAAEKSYTYASAMLEERKKYID